MITRCSPCMTFAMEMILSMILLWLSWLCPDILVSPILRYSTFCHCVASSISCRQKELINTLASYWVAVEREREKFYLTTHSTHFIYGYMASDIWLRTILIVRKETCCRHIGYSFRLAARVLLYAPSHRQDSTYHGLCYTSRGALARTRNSSMGPPHEGSIRRPIAPWANALTTELHLAPQAERVNKYTNKHTS